MVDSSVSPENWKEYAALTKDRALRRYLSMELDVCRGELSNAETAAEEIRSRFEKAVADLGSMEGVSRAEPTSKESIAEQREVWEQAVVNGYAGLDTGIPWFNSMFGGLLRCGVYYISGPPGCYKTTIVRQIAEYVASQLGLRVDFASLEQSSGQVLGSIVAHRANLSVSRLNCRPKREDLDSFDLVSPAVAGWPLHVSDRGFTPTTLWSWARRAVAAGSELLILDYLQALRSEGRVESEERRVSEATSTCTQIAKDLKTRFLVVSSESNEGRLRYSGQIEYDAWGWLRLERQDTLQAQEDVILATVKKNRFGMRPDPFELRARNGVIRYEGPVKKNEPD
jgi:replicative DNA helicase